MQVPRAAISDAYAQTWRIGCCRSHLPPLPMARTSLHVGGTSTSDGVGGCQLLSRTQTIRIRGVRPFTMTVYMIWSSEFHWKRDSVTDISILLHLAGFPTAIKRLVDEFECERMVRESSLRQQRSTSFLFDHSTLRKEIVVMILYFSDFFPPHCVDFTYS